MVLPEVFIHKAGRRKQNSRTRELFSKFSNSYTITYCNATLQVIATEFFQITHQQDICGLKYVLNKYKISK